MNKYILIQKYLGKIIEKRRLLNNPDASILLQIIDKNQADRLEKLLQELEPKITNFPNIFKIESELNNIENPDDRFDDMIAELRGAWLLNDRGYTNITYLKTQHDFSCTKNSEEYGVEIEFIRGPNFKGQKRIAPDSDLAYKLNAELVLNKLKDKIVDGFSQIPKNRKRIVIAITNDLQYAKEWFGKEIEEFRKEIETVYQSKILLVTNDGDIYG
jgi:hypothetical protein